jgi:hypothetical protein
VAQYFSTDRASAKYVGNRRTALRPRQLLNVEELVVVVVVIVLLLLVLVEVEVDEVNDEEDVD